MALFSEDKYKDLYDELDISNEALESDDFLLMSDLEYEIGKSLSSSNECVDAMHTLYSNYDNISNEQLDVLYQHLGLEPSNEALDSKKQNLMGKLESVFDTLTSKTEDDIDAISNLYLRATHNKSKTLNKLKEKIRSGELKSKDSLDKKVIKDINGNLGVFYAMGFSIKKDKADDLIKFFDIVKDSLGKNGRVADNLRISFDMYDKKGGIFEVMTKPNTLKESKINKDFLKELKPLKGRVDVTSSKYKTGMLISHFNRNIRLASLVEQKGKLKVHYDVIESKAFDEVPALSEKALIDLIDYYIDNLDNVKKEIKALQKELDNKYKLFNVMGFKFGKGGKAASVFGENTTDSSVLGLVSGIRKFENNLLDHMKNNIKDSLEIGKFITKLAKESTEKNK